eukprot:gene11152-18773_t
MQLAFSNRALKLWRAYEGQLNRRPVQTQMATSALLWAVGDTLAQKVEQRETLDTKRVAMTAGFGASFMGPVGHYWYLALTGIQGFKSKIEQDFVPTYMAELFIWPGFQTFNFTKVPLQHQLLAVNCMTLVDATFLAWARSQVGGSYPKSPYASPILKGSWPGLGHR